MARSRTWNCLVGPGDPLVPGPPCQMDQSDTDDAPQLLDVMVFENGQLRVQALVLRELLGQFLAGLAQRLPESLQSKVKIYLGPAQVGGSEPNVTA